LDQSGNDLLISMRELICGRETMLKHHVFFIHGISDKRRIEKDFRHLGERIRCQFRKIHHQDPDERLELVPVEWDDAVAEEKKIIFEKCFGRIRPLDQALVLAGDPLQQAVTAFDTLTKTPNPIEFLFERYQSWRPWRYFNTTFLGDLIAYGDENDNGIRRSVWQVLKTHLLEKSTDVPEFSIVGHSLGSVIAYDFLSSILAPHGPTLFTFGHGEGAVERTEPAKLRQIKESFRNFYSFGSLIPLYLMRKKQVALTGGAGRNPFSGTTHKWINFVDTDDVLAYPVQPLLADGQITGQNPNPKDVFVKSGWLPILAHMNYWRSDEVAREIVQGLTPKSVKTHTQERERGRSRDRELVGTPKS
jgi:hypothetical protein